MALADFIQSLQEQDVVYSTPPQPSIRVIPPENQCIKIIPPETLSVDPPAPKVIKLKIKPKAQPVVEDNVVQAATQPKQPILQPVNNTNRVNPAPVITQSQDVIPTYTPHKTDVQTAVNKPQRTQTVAKPTPPIVNEEPKQLTDEDIFNSTGTEYSKKAMWLEYFEKAKTSRKSNPIVDRMKIGRFTITPDNKVLLLPDYDIVGKDPDDVLKDKWF